MKTCSTCKEKKSLEEFHRNKSTSDGFAKCCKSCAKARDKKQYNKHTDERKIYLKEKSYLARERNRQFLLDFLSEHACVDCGESDPIVLEFDHQGDKNNDVSRMAHCGCSIETLKKELSKCEIRCANCHRRKTARDFNWFRQRSSVVEQGFCKAQVGGSNPSAGS